MASVVRFDKWEDSEGNPVLDASDGPINFPSRRNLLYNGAMQVHQRGTSATGITTGGYYTADRWQTNLGSLGTWTQTIENDGPTGSGFAKSLKVFCTTANASPDAGAFYSLAQRLEGQDLQVLIKGTPDAKEFSVSFWVKSNVTGTYVVDFQDSDNTRRVSAQYSVSSSGVWEKKVIALPADTVGPLDNDSNNSLSILFRLGAGSGQTSGTLRTVWSAAVGADAAPGQTNLAAATSNYWQITGVQLEVGPVATPFEFKTFGQELAECQRYYYLHAQGDDRTICTTAVYNSTLFYGTVFLKQPMRTIPSLVITTGSAYYRNYSQGSSDSLTSFIASTSVATTNAVEISGVIGVNRTGASSFFRTNNANSYVAWDAEL
jgi:hypothetical protein